MRDIVEESVRIVPSTGDVLWTPSVRHAVHYGAEHFGIGNRFCSEERGLLHIGVAEVKAGDIKRRGDGDCFRGGYVTAERPIKAAKSCCVIEIGVDVGIGGQQCERGGGDGDRVRPMLTTCQLVRERPHLFLIA